MSLKQISAGIITHEGKVLIGQRKRGKAQEFLWEFPGGKLEEGETLEECLRRELLEELDLNICVGKLFGTYLHDYSFGTIALNVFYADCPDPEIQNVCEHEQVKWVCPAELKEYEFAPADIPVVEDYLKSLEI